MLPVACSVCLPVLFLFQHFLECVCVIYLDGLMISINGLLNRFRCGSIKRHCCWCFCCWCFAPNGKVLLRRENRGGRRGFLFIHAIEDDAAVWCHWDASASTVAAASIHCQLLLPITHTAASASSTLSSDSIHTHSIAHCNTLTQCCTYAPTLSPSLHTHTHTLGKAVCVD